MAYLLPPIDGRRSIPHFLARLVLCWIAVLNPLQTYPVAGSQVFSVPTCTCSARGLSRRWCTLARLVRGGARGPVDPRRGGGCAPARLAVASVAAGRGSERTTEPHSPRIAWCRTASHPSRPGKRVWRAHGVPPRTRADSLLRPGFSSLYFWTGTEPPTLDVIGHVMDIYPAERQTAMVNALLAAPRPVLVRFRGWAPAPLATKFLQRLDPSLSRWPNSASTRCSPAERLRSRNASVPSPKFVTYFAGPRRPWRRCASSEYSRYSCVGAPCQERRSLAEIGNELRGQDTMATPQRAARRRRRRRRRAS